MGFYSSSGFIISWVCRGMFLYSPLWGSGLYTSIGFKIRISCIGCGALMAHLGYFDYLGIPRYRTTFDFELPWHIYIFSPLFAYPPLLFF